MSKFPLGAIITLRNDKDTACAAGSRAVVVEPRHNAATSLLRDKYVWVKWQLPTKDKNGFPRMQADGCYYASSFEYLVGDAVMTDDRSYYEQVSHYEQVSQ